MSQETFALGQKGTFEDRLPSELRLGSTADLRANQVLPTFLPDYNWRIGPPRARSKDPALRSQET